VYFIKGDLKKPHDSRLILLILIEEHVFWCWNFLQSIY